MSYVQIIEEVLISVFQPYNFLSPDSRVEIDSIS